eukprot:471404-Prymnesium_polylepis.1
MMHATARCDVKLLDGNVFSEYIRIHMGALFRSTGLRAPETIPVLADAGRSCGCHEPGAGRVAKAREGVTAVPER